LALEKARELIPRGVAGVIYAIHCENVIVTVRKAHARRKPFVIHRSGRVRTHGTVFQKTSRCVTEICRADVVETRIHSCQKSRHAGFVWKVKVIIRRVRRAVSGHLHLIKDCLCQIRAAISIGTTIEVADGIRHDEDFCGCAHREREGGNSVTTVKIRSGGRAPANRCRVRRVVSTP